MIYPSEQRPSGTLRLKLNEGGSVRSFGALLTEVVDCYDLMERFQLLGETVDEEIHSKAREPIWQAIYTGLESHQELEQALRAMTPFTNTLTVGCVKLESPGWIDVIGSLNPLRVIADFITHWRAENTKRMGIQSKESLDRDKLRAKLATDIFKMMPQENRFQNARRVIDVTNSIVTPSTLALQTIASDKRIEGAFIVGDSTAEPGKKT